MTDNCYYSYTSQKQIKKKIKLSTLILKIYSKITFVPDFLEFLCKSRKTSIATSIFSQTFNLKWRKIGFFVKFLSTLNVSSKKITTSQNGQVSALLVEKQLKNVTYEQHCDLCFSICLECFPFISVMLFPYSPKKWFWCEFILQPLTLMEELIFFVPANSEELEKLIKLLTLKNREA